MVRSVIMCKLQEPPVKQLKMTEPAMNIIVSQTVDDILVLAPKPKARDKMEKKLTQRPVKIHTLGQNNEVKKAKKQKKTPSTGIEVIETLEEAPVKQINPEPALEQHAGFMYTPSEIDIMGQKAEEFKFPYQDLKSTNVAMPGPSSKGQPEYLPTHEEIMFQDMLECGPSSMETQPDLEQTEIQVLDMPTDLEQVALEEYLIDESKPLHANFVLPHQGKRSTCPAYFGSLENKQNVLDALCNEMHTKELNQWGTLACHCGLVPILRLSQTPRNLNKVFLSRPKTREKRCGYFQWVHQPPKPNYVPKPAIRSALKKGLNDVVQERMQKRPKVEETIGGFVFP